MRKLFISVGLLLSIWTGPALSHQAECDQALVAAHDRAVLLVDTLVHGGESLVDDFIYEGKVVRPKVIARLNDLSPNVKSLEVARLNREIWAEKAEHHLLKDVDFHTQQKLKEPIRNRQFVCALLTRAELLNVFKEKSLRSAEQYLETLTASSAKYPLKEILAGARRAQKVLGPTLAEGEWVEIFGSYPMLQAIAGQSDIDIVLSDSLEKKFRRLIRGRYLDNGTFKEPRAFDSEAQVFQQQFLNFEQALGFSSTQAPGALLSVATRPTTMQHGAEFVDGTYDELLRHLTLVSPLTIRFTPNHVRLRVYDGVRPPRGKPAPFIEIEL